MTLIQRRPSIHWRSNFFRAGLKSGGRIDSHHDGDSGYIGRPVLRCTNWVVALWKGLTNADFTIKHGISGFHHPMQEFFTTRTALAVRIGGTLFFQFFHILEIMIPIDFHIFQRGRSTTKQIKYERWSTTDFADVSGSNLGTMAWEISTAGRPRGEATEYFAALGSIARSVTCPHWRVLLSPGMWEMGNHELLISQNRS